MALKENTMLYLTDFPIISKISDQDIIKFLSSFSESILQVKEEKKIINLYHTKSFLKITHQRINVD